MKNDKLIAKYLAVTSCFVTLFVLAGPVADPVNATKLMALGTFSGAILFLSIPKKFAFKIDFKNPSHILFFLLIVTFITPVLFSKTPISQNLYGVSGRNSGLVTFISLIILLISASNIKDKSLNKIILNGFFVASIGNIFYGAWVWAVGDFIAWNNVYRSLLGTFGNPDFSSAFYGIAFSVFLNLTFNIEYKAYTRLLLFISSISCLVLISHTNAIQGFVVAAIGTFFVIFLQLIFIIRKKYLTLAYILLSAVSFIFSILGMLQKGPLENLLYKRSVSLRGSYWEAAYQTGMHNPFTGVGLDSFGNWYFRYRSEKAATWLPGPNVLTNTAHNLYLDLFAFGGVPLLIIFLSINIFVFIRIIKYFRNSQKSLNFTFTSFVIIFVTFQAQAVISIGQIGLLIWWAISAGVILNFTNANLSGTHSQKTKMFFNQSFIPTELIASAGLISGFILSSPPFFADHKWTDAIRQQNADKLIASTKASYFNPLDSERLAKTTLILAENNLLDQAHQVAITATQFNPYHFDSWKVLYYLPNTTQNEKFEARKKLVFLDPLNPKWKNLK